MDGAAGDFHLTGPTLPGASLEAPYAVDQDGITHGGDGTWDRGAFELEAN